MTKINIILLGESGVGKTTLLHRFQTGQFKEKESLKATLGADFHVKNLVLENEAVSLFIWDTAGQEQYRSVVRNYYRQGEGVLLVYDVTNPESFYKLSKWLCELRDINENAQVLIAGNKNEDPAVKAVAVSAVKGFAREEKLEYMEMSAMSGENVEEAFLYLARKILMAKGILTDKSAVDNDQDHSSSKEGSSKNTVPDIGNDIIRLEDTPMTKKIAKRRWYC